MMTSCGAWCCAHTDASVVGIQAARLYVGTTTEIRMGSELCEPAHGLADEGQRIGEAEDLVAIAAPHGDEVGDRAPPSPPLGRMDVELGARATERQEEAVDVAP